MASLSQENSTKSDFQKLKRGFPTVASLNYRKVFEGPLKNKIQVRNSKKKHILELQDFQATAAVG